MAIPATCGHAKEVPEAIVYLSLFMRSMEGTQISTPGAHMSGCVRLREKIDNERLLPFFYGKCTINYKDLLTLRIPFINGFGPLLENSATVKGFGFSTILLLQIFALIGVLGLGFSL